MEAEAQVPWMPTVTGEIQEEAGEVAVLGDNKLARRSWLKTRWVGTDLLERKGFCLYKTRVSGYSAASTILTYWH